MSRVCQFLFKVALLAGVIVFALTGLAANARAEGPLKVEYSIDPQKPEATHLSHITIKLYDSDGKPFSNAKVMFSADMQHDPNSSSMSMMRSVEQESQLDINRPGQFLSHVTFSMPGMWDAKVEVDSPKGKQTETFAIEVIEPKPLTGVNWPVIGGAVVFLALAIGVPAVLRVRANRNLEEDEE